MPTSTATNPSANSFASKASYLQKFEYILVLLVIAIGFFYNLGKVEFHGDESHWIGYSDRFEIFIQRQYQHPIWRDVFPNLYNPVTTYYVIGLSRAIGGFEAQELNGIYDFSKNYEENLAAGNIPDDNLLWWGRAGVASMAILGIWLLFVLLRHSGNIFVAYAWVAIAVSDKYLRSTLRRAMNEGMLFAFILLSIFCLYKVIAHWEETGRRASLKRAVWSALAGAFAGLAGQTKLNGLAVVGGVFLGLLLVGIREHQHIRATVSKLAGLIALVSLFCCVAFVAPNPVLYAAPLGTTIKMLQIRKTEMEAQAKTTSRRTFLTFREKWLIAPLMLNRYTPLSRYALLSRLRLNLLLFAAGVGSLAFQLRGWFLKQNKQHELIALASGGLLASLPAFLVLMDWDRYFFLPYIFNTVIILFGLCFVLHLILNVLRKVLRHTSETAETPETTS